MDTLVSERIVQYWRTTLETSVLLCALMCLSSVNIIFICIIMFYQINSLTHTHSIKCTIMVVPSNCAVDNLL